MGLELIEINFEKMRSPTIAENLEQTGVDVARFLRELEDFTQKRIEPGKVLIFLDEIQAQPKVYSYLRYLYEEYPELPVIAAGSLLEFYLGTEIFSVPVGRIDYFYLGPLDFDEFLLARGQKILLKRMREPRLLTEENHNKLYEFLREYFYVGGMPAGVRAFINSGSLAAARKIQWSILQTYRDDFLKYAKQKQIPHLQAVFDFVPFNVGQKVKYSAINEEAKAAQIRAGIDLLSKARVAWIVPHTNATGLPLSTFKDERVFKLYFIDIGLMLAAQKVTLEQINSSFASLNQRGEMFEQFIAQHLFFRNQGLEEPDLYYWLKDKTPGKAELDFLFQEGTEIFPVEAKAGATGSLKSLWQFVWEKEVRMAVLFSEQKYGVSIEKHQLPGSSEYSEVKMMKVPHYLAPRLMRLLKSELRS